MAIIEKNKFLQMLDRKPKPVDKAFVQTLIPGAKSRGECSDECLILRNCLNLNKRLLALVFQYREVMSKINVFSNTPDAASRRDNGYEYIQGYGQCNEDIKRVCGKMMTREEENTIDIQSLMNESHHFIRMIEGERGSNYQRRARELRLRYDALFEKIKGVSNSL